MRAAAAALLLAAAARAAGAGAPADRGGVSSLLAFGDWGGSSDAVPADPQLLDCAKGMAKVAQQLSAGLVLALGDNFYEHGVTADTAPARFNATFESVFTAASLRVPFYAVAGNHDYGYRHVPGDVASQCAYTGKGSGRWQFPSPYYSVTKAVAGGGTLELVMIDTVLLLGKSDMQSDGTVTLDPPEDPAVAQTQWEWINQTLAASTADYLFVGGHYPVYSIGPHGSLMLGTQLPALLERHGVQAYFAGHDHMLEHIVTNTTHHIVSGAGSDAFYVPKIPTLPPGAAIKFNLTGLNAGSIDAGFVAAAFTPSGAVVTHYAGDGTLLYTSDPIPPRPKAGA